MVARTLPFKSRDKPELPSITKEVLQQIEADQTDIKKQLKHANEQLALTNTYQGQLPVNLIAVNVPCTIFRTHVVCSMSRSGNVWDNAAMESFFSSVKAERTGNKTTGRAMKHLIIYRPLVQRQT